MKHGLCVRGIVAASLAFAATTASAAPPYADYADTPGVAKPTLISAGLSADDIPTISANASVAPANLAGQPLAELVRKHGASIATDGGLECLAAAVYFEARGESLEGQLAVADVVLNRAASGEYPTSICEVVKQPQQFSFVRNGLFPPIDQNNVAWRTAVAVADIADKKLAAELTSDVLWYHAEYVSPSWGRHLDRVTQIGAHIFYRRA
jgi:spore germination cell wall hydrolase CwlJ-like protein